MYGILSLLKSLKGKDAMRRVLKIAQEYPNARPVRNMKNPVFDEKSRLNNAISLAEGSDRYLNPYPGTFMNYVRHKVPNRKMFKDVANYYRLNPEKRAVMDDWHQEMGSKGWWSTGFMDGMIQDAIQAMAGKNLKTRGPTDHEKYLLALLRQKRQEANKGAKILPFRRPE